MKICFCVVVVLCVMVIIVMLVFVGGDMLGMNVGGVIMLVLNVMLIDVEVKVIDVGCRFVMLKYGVFDNIGMLLMMMVFKVGDVVMILLLYVGDKVWVWVENVNGMLMIVKLVKWL